MIRRLIENDIRANKLSSAATFFFMAVSAMLLCLTVLLGGSLLGSIDHLMEEAQTPQNIAHTISSPEFVTYMGVGNGQIRIDVQYGIGLDFSQKL